MFSPRFTRFARQRTIRGVASAMFVVAALAASAGPVGAQQTPPPPPTETTPAITPDVTPENAATLLPPGYVKSGDDYVYNGGAVIVTPAFASQKVACRSGWLCLYRHVNWGGTMWRFHDHYWQDLAPYGANDQISSWNNRERRTAVLGWNSTKDRRGKAPYLHLSANARGSSVGNWNDQASSVLP